MPFPDISPIAFELGPFAVRWYALGYLAGVLLGALYGATLLARKSLWADNRPPFEPAAIYDFAFWAVIGIVVGGRLGYVLFYNLPYFAANPVAIVQLWDGGMSFHGGFIGIIVAIALFTRARGGRFLSGLDLLAAIGTIGIFLVRIANFINGELWGKEAPGLPWAVVFPGAGEVPRHPTQLYEAGLEGLLTFLIIRYCTHVGFTLRRPGLTAGIFGVAYAVSRMLVELVRVPDPQLGYLFGGWLTMGMLLSLPIMVAGIALIAYAASRRRA